MQLNFLKMHCMGSDFMVVEFITQEGYIRPALMSKLADRTLGVGFEFLLVLEHPRTPDVDFHCRVFQYDGQELELNAAAARCAARFVTDRGLTGRRRLRFASAQQTLDVELGTGRRVSVTHSAPVLEPALIPFQAEHYRTEYDMPVHGYGQILMGVVQVVRPQVVVRTDDINDAALAALAQSISRASCFQQPVAVHFVQTIDEQLLRVRGFFPDSSQTIDECGVAAAVVSAKLRGWVQSEVTVTLAGNEVQVDWSDNQPLKITGQVALVYEGQITI